MDPSSQNFIVLRFTDETSSNVRTYNIDAEKIDNLVQLVCKGLGVDSLELAWNFVDDDEMQVLNRQYREKDKSTDVLSFPQQEWPFPLVFEAPDLFPDEPAHDEEEDDEVIPDMLGDIVISPNVALQNARSIGHELDREVCFLLVHGILHLCGHDHMNPEEEERMTREQQSIMKYLESRPEGPLWTNCARVGT